MTVPHAKPRGPSRAVTTTARVNMPAFSRCVAFSEAISATYMDAEQSGAASHTRVLRAPFGRRSGDVADRVSTAAVFRSMRRSLRKAATGVRALRVTRAARADAMRWRCSSCATPWSRIPNTSRGTVEFDTRVMRGRRRRDRLQVGRRRRHGLASIPQGLGLASKVLDGSSRGRGPITIAALRALGSPVADATDLAGFAGPIVYNRAGRAVGTIRAVSQGSA